jgi:hypothetical protein
MEDNEQELCYDLSDIEKLTLCNALMLDLLCARFIKQSYDPQQEYQRIAVRMHLFIGIVDRNCGNDAVTAATLIGNSIRNVWRLGGNEDEFRLEICKSVKP